MLRPADGKSVVGSVAEADNDTTNPYVTDNGNFILDLFLERPIPDKQTAADSLRSMVGVIEHGLFLNMASAILIAAPDGVKLHAKQER